MEFFIMRITQNMLFFFFRGGGMGSGVCVCVCACVCVVTTYMRPLNGILYYVHNKKYSGVFFVVFLSLGLGPGGGCGWVD